VADVLVLVPDFGQIDLEDDRTVEPGERYGITIPKGSAIGHVP
jgi:hypothetical protein